MNNKKAIFGHGSTNNYIMYYNSSMLCIPDTTVLKALSSINVNTMNSPLLNLLRQCLFPIKISLQYLCT